jgi:putative oxidoreductase
MSANATTIETRSTDRADVLALVGRVLLASLFIPAGFAKLTAIGGTAAWFGSIGLPAPTVLAVLTGLLELFGGIAVLMGYQTRIAAIALAVFTLAATAVAHLNFADQMQMLLFQKNLAVTGGFLVLVAFGAGRLSLDARREA